MDEARESFLTNICSAVNESKRYIPYVKRYDEEIRRECKSTIMNLEVMLNSLLVVHRVIGKSLSVAKS